MRIITSIPKIGEPPEWSEDVDFSEQEAREQEYLLRVQAWAKANGSGAYAGQEVYWQYADGYAYYVVVSLRPAVLVHVAIGDVLEFPYIERLTALDVQERLRQIEAIKSLFQKTS